MIKFKRTLSEGSVLKNKRSVIKLTEPFVKTVPVTANYPAWEIPMWNFEVLAGFEINKPYSDAYVRSCFVEA